MEFVPPGASDVVLDRLWQLWLDLPDHPNVLEAVGDQVDGLRLLRYAALDWRYPLTRLNDGPHTVARVATWGVELVDVCAFLSACVPNDVLGWMACPIVKIDLEAETRVAFVPAKANAKWMERLPPEIVDRWPGCDDRGLVFVVGQLLRSLIAVDDPPLNTPITRIIERSLARDPAGRFASLEELLERSDGGPCTCAAAARPDGRGGSSLQAVRRDGPGPI